MSRRAKLQFNSYDDDQARCTGNPPDSALYAAGISAGTGLLIRYLGEQGEDTPLRGAFVCLTEVNR
jgi:predicted alpha/beta-fold hydrolase